MNKSRVLVRKSSDPMAGILSSKPTVIAETHSSPKIKMDTVIEEIAQHKFYIMNFKWDGAQRDFPMEPYLRNVRFYYPNAIGGPLYVDMPQMENEIRACERKKKILKEKGFRYLVFKRGMTLVEALEDLGEWHGQRTSQT